MSRKSITVLAFVVTFVVSLVSFQSGYSQGVKRAELRFQGELYELAAAFDADNVRVVEGDEMVAIEPVTAGNPVIMVRKSVRVGQRTVKLVVGKIYDHQPEVDPVPVFSARSNDAIAQARRLR